MKQLIRFAVFGVIAALLVCVAVFTLGGRARRSATPTAQPVALAEIDPTRRQPTAIPRGHVSKALMGAEWPLSVDEGTIVCDRSSILLRAPDGHLYAVNGTARSQVGHFGWLDIRDITLPDPNTEGLIMNVQPIIDQGLDLCQ